MTETAAVSELAGRTVFVESILEPKKRRTHLNTRVRVQPENGRFVLRGHGFRVPRLPATTEVRFRESVLTDAARERVQARRGARR